ncbi:MAG: NADPH:quinone oxidoreductase family protein [Steroidobacteraceae bacterium]
MSAVASSVPQHMQALVVERLAPNFDGCSVQTRPIPQPAAGEVLIRVQAACIGFPDLLMTHGGYQYKPELPFVLGSEMAGEVVRSDHTAFTVGTRVACLGRGGAFAEYAVCGVDSMRKLPTHFSFAEAAAFPAAYLTAYVGFVKRAQLQAGEWVLVHGASGGIGLAAVDLAKALGARVIAASSSVEKLRALSQAYAPDALLNSSGPFREQVNEITGGRGVDVVFDPVGGEVFDESTHCLAFGGRLLVVGFASGRIPTFKVNHALIKGYAVVGVRAGEYTRRFPERGRECLDAIWELAAQKRVHPRVHASVALNRWREAFELMTRRQTVGRVVLIPQE